MREVRRMHLHGLSKISILQDLREAPDAIMPGNFVGQKVQATVIDKEGDDNDNDDSRDAPKDGVSIEK